MSIATALAPGDIVDYHGSLTRRHGLHIVAGGNRGGLTLLSDLYPADWRSVIYKVRRVSVTATGEFRALCACCHLPADLALSATCPNHGSHLLPCAEHAHPCPASFAPARITL